MNDPLSQSALREWRQHMTLPARAFALLAVAVVLTLLAPFDMDQSLRPLPAFFYWAVMSVAGYSIGYAGNQVAQARAPDAGPWVRSLIAGPITALGVFVLVMGLNYGFLGLVPTMRSVLVIGANVLVIAFVVSAAMQLAYHAPTTSQGPTATDTPPTILDRLPFDKRAPLIALSSEDHYIRIRTLKGEELVLLRLSDAMREVGQTQGLQVHRSHWIALDQVAEVQKFKDRAELRMSDGTTIPVSRSYIAAIRGAGLIQ